MALLTYAQDHDDTLPGNSFHAAGVGEPLGWMVPYDAARSTTWRIWARDLMPYVRNMAVYTCPQSKPRSEEGPCDYSGAGTDPCELGTPGAGTTSYLLNGIAADRPLAELAAPADLVFLHEVRNYNRVAQVKPRLNPATGLWTGFAHGYYDGVHHEGANLLFCDGHARWQRRDAIRFAQFGAPSELNPGLPTNVALGEAAATAQNTLEFKGGL
jgi:prepilin-type processing-associated H-X9-DG protein